MSANDVDSVPSEVKKPIVLVVDDEESVRNIAVRMLQRIGYDAVAAADGQAGIDYFRQHAGTIAGVLIDMTMPNMTGEAACLAIRAIDPSVRIVVMSGHAEEEMLQRMAYLNLAGFLQKPFNLELMRTTIAGIIP